MDIAEKVLRAKQDLDDVYEGGKQAGQKSEYDKFWDAFQQNGNRTNYREGFAGYGWTGVTFAPKYPLNNITNASSMFSSSRVTYIDYDLDFSNSEDCAYLFNSAINLTRIKSIKFNNNIAASKNNYIFASTTRLADITVVGTIGFSLSFSATSRLTVASMKSIINALENFVGTDKEGVYTIKFHATCWSNLEASGTSPNGGTWAEYVRSLGWLT